LQSLLSVLKKEIGQEEALLAASKAFDEELALRQKQFADAQASKDYEAGLSSTAELKQSIPLLEQKLQRLSADIAEQPALKLLRRNEDDSQARAEKLAQLQASVDALQESLKMRIKVMALTPQLETLLMTTQHAIQEADKDQSLEIQEQKLKELEAQKQKLQTVLDALPLTETDEEKVGFLNQ